jgi:Leucine-rich repeat (LRR) protein
LNLDKNNLEKTPVSLSVISTLQHLIKLSLYKTTLTDIFFLKGLSNLTFLDLKNNKIKELPKFIMQWAERGVPVDMEKVYGVSKKIYLYCNPIEKSPMEIVKKGMGCHQGLL